MNIRFPKNTLLSINNIGKVTFGIMHLIYVEDNKGREWNIAVQKNAIVSFLCRRKPRFYTNLHWGLRRLCKYCQKHWSCDGRIVVLVVTGGIWLDDIRTDHTYWDFNLNLTSRYVLKRKQMIMLHGRSRKNWVLRRQFQINTTKFLESLTI